MLNPNNAEETITTSGGAIPIEVIYIQLTKGPSPLLITGIVITSIVIVAIAITLIVSMCRHDGSKVYAEEDEPSDDNYAGNAKVVSVYRLKP